MNNRIKWISLATVAGALASASPGHAQFGMSVDPVQSGHAITQIVNEGKSLEYQAADQAMGTQRNLTLTQQLLQDLKMVATAAQIYGQSVTTYNTIYNNLRYFSSKELWRTAENALVSGQVANKFGETSGLQATLNGAPQNASMAWKLMNLAVSATSSNFLGNQATTSLNNLATLAGIEALDAASTQCLGAVGTYNQQRQTNAPATTNLQTTQAATTSFTNTELQQLNLLNMNGSQHINEAQAQGQLQACLAAQSAVQNMQQRNAAATALNDAQFKMSQQSINPTYYGGGSNTWDSYF